MTSYRVIHANKRQFIFRVPEKHVGDLSTVTTNNTRVTTAGDTRVTTAGDTRVTNETSQTYQLAVHANTRNFTVRVPQLEVN